VPTPALTEAVYLLLGKRLAQLRTDRDLSQETLAEWTGLTRASIANIEKGRQRVFIHQLYRFAQALRVDLLGLLPSPDEVMDAEVPEAEKQYLDKVKQISGMLQIIPSSAKRPTRRRA
jgi:transcriptional regulator with XRE-family HTH domain